MDVNEDEKLQFSAHLSSSCGRSHQTSGFRSDLVFDGKTTAIMADRYLRRFYALILVVFNVSYSHESCEVLRLLSPIGNQLTTSVNKQLKVTFELNTEGCTNKTYLITVERMEQEKPMILCRVHHNTTSCSITHQTYSCRCLGQSGSVEFLETLVKPGNVEYRLRLVDGTSQSDREEKITVHVIGELKILSPVGKTQKISVNDWINMTFRLDKCGDQTYIITVDRKEPDLPVILCRIHHNKTCIKTGNETVYSCRCVSQSGTVEFWDKLVRPGDVEYRWRWRDLTSGKTSEKIFFFVDDDTHGDRPRNINVVVSSVGVMLLVVVAVAVLCARCQKLKSSGRPFFDSRSS